MRVKIEGIDIPQQSQLVKSTINLDVRRRPLRGRRGPQTEAIFDRYAEPSQQGAREAAETLPGRNGVVAMVPMFGDLAFNAILSHRTRSFSDVVMGTNEDQVIRVIEEMPDRLNFHSGCRLSGAQRVEADDYDAIDAHERAIERRPCAIICDAFDLNELVACQCLGLFGEDLEIRFLDVIQKACDTLINLAGIRQLLEIWIKETPQLENRWEAIIDDGEWRAGFRWAAPGEIEKYPSTAHSSRSL
jgi:hypothetical protein